MTAPISFSGLVSGIDTESIIKQMLDIQREPITRLENRAMILDIKREAFRDVNTQLLNFQNSTMTLRLESTFSSRSATSSDQSKLQATASFSAAKTTHRVTINQLAQEATVASNRYLSRASLLGSNTVGINLVGGANFLNSPGSGRLIGGVALSETTTLADLGLTDTFSLKIDPDADGSRAAIEITGLNGTTTISQLMVKIRQKVDSVKVQLAYDESQGARVLQLGSDYVGIDVSVSGKVAEAVFGITAGATASSGGSTGLGSARAKAAVTPVDLPIGTAVVTSSNGLAGSLTGTVDLAAAAGGNDILDLTLSELGVTDFSGFEIDPDAGGATGNVSVLQEDGTALSGDNTLADLIEAVNRSVPDVTAQLVDGSGGEVYLRITANEGGRDITINQIGATAGITQMVLGSGETVTTSNATSSSNDFTMVQTFYRRGSLDSAERRVVSGVKENYRGVGVTDLIDGVTLVGASVGEVFTPGTARLQISSSERVAIGRSERTQVFGAVGVTNAAFASSLGLDAFGTGNTGLETAISELNTGNAFTLDDGAGITAGTFKVADKTLTLTQDDIDGGLTLAELLARINSAGANMVLTYEASADRFIATASQYGASGSVSFGSYTGAAGESNVLKVLGLTNYSSQITTSGGIDETEVDLDAELNQAGLTITPTSGTFTINGVSIAVDATTDSLNDIINKINSSAAGVTASFDSNSKRISLLQNVDDETVENYIRVGSSSDTSNLMKVLRIVGGSSDDGSLKAVESPTATKNVGSQRRVADLEVDGIHYTRNSNSIDDITPGVTYQLVGVTDSPVAITVSGDSQKAIDALAQFVVEYNKLVKLLNPERLDETERKYLDPVTDEERSSLTYEELVQRLDRFETYNKNEEIRKDSGLRIFQSQLRSILFSRVDGIDPTITSLADIGLNTGDPGAPITTNYEGVLVADSTDLEEIKTALQNNATLLDALARNDQAVGRLFNQEALSTITAKGTIAFNQSTPLANEIVFQVYDGQNTATVTLPAGQLSRSEILSKIVASLERAGINDVEASFDGTGHLKFRNEKTTGSAYFRIIDKTDSGATDRLNNRFGISSGSFTGPDAEQSAGVAERLHRKTSEATGISGFVRQKISFGGLYGQGTIYDEIVSVQDQIAQMEDRVSKREDILRQKFAAMEKAIASLQSQQNAISQYLNTGAASSSG